MVTLVFKKHFTKGTLAGLTITDHLPFVHKGRALDWMDNVEKNTGLDWCFAKMATGEPAYIVFDADTPLQAAVNVFEQWYEAWK